MDPLRVKSGASCGEEEGKYRRDSLVQLSMPRGCCLFTPLIHHQAPSTITTGLPQLHHRHYRWVLCVIAMSIKVWIDQVSSRQQDRYLEIHCSPIYLRAIGLY